MRSTNVFAITAALAICTLAACGGGGEAPSGPPGATGPAPTADAAAGKSAANMLTAADITLGEIDKDMAAKGQAIYDVKCQACHSTGPNRVVGPGWKGVTERRKPEWIMNMMLNIDVMLETDPEAQKGLEECLVRMANQGLSKDQDREVLHFMRQEFKRNILTRLAALIALPVLHAFKKRVDPRVYNGASLLGLQHIVIKSHGSADDFSFANAIKIALLEVEKGLPQRITKTIETLLEKESA